MVDIGYAPKAAMNWRHRDRQVGEPESESMDDDDCAASGRQLGEGSNIFCRLRWTWM